MQVEFTDVPEQPALALRTTCRADELGDTIGRALVAVFDHLHAQGVTPTGPPYVRYATFSDELIELEGGFPVEALRRGSRDVVPTVLPAGRVARGVHVGPYEDLPRAHEQVRSAIAARGLSIVSAPWEVYRTDPGVTPREELETEVVYPVG